jgi:hypothetical protein
LSPSPVYPRPSIPCPAQRVCQTFRCIPICMHSGQKRVKQRCVSLRVYRRISFFLTAVFISSSSTLSQSRH